MNISSHASSNLTRAGVDVGGTTIRASLFAPDGTLLSSCSLPSRRGNKAVIQDICDSIRGAVAQFTENALELDRSPFRLASIGIGIPGTIDAANGTVRNAVNLGIENCDLVSSISWEMSAPVTVENDVNAAAMGAVLVFRQAAGSLAYLNLGTGAAAGFVANGQVMHGSTEMAGEIGHIQIDPEGTACACGQRGCLETMISGSALDKLWPVEKGWPGTDLFRTAASGDSHAMAIRDRYCTRLFQAIEIIALAVDPQLIIIGGGVSHIGEPLLEGIRETIRSEEGRSSFVRSLHLRRRLFLAPPDIDLACLGAAHHAMPFAMRDFSFASHTRDSQTIPVREAHPLNT